MQMALSVQLLQALNSTQNKMTLRIEKVWNGRSTTIRLIGRMRREHLEELKAQMKDSGPKVTLDLNEVSLVDVDSVRFLGICQTEGVELLHCSPYIRDWIAKERG
jgi:anti-anti-sigma regulatory factor